MDVTLNEVVKTYLADEEYQRPRQNLLKMRNESIPALQALISRFVHAEINLQEFRTQLERTLRAGEDWGATGLSFMMELNKLGKYHDDKGSIAETELRTVLTGLNVRNVGQRIERFYNFLLRERERLRREGKSSGMIVGALNSAFIISLFAFWLDPEGQPLVYYVSLRKGLFLLIKANLLPATPELRIGPQAVEVRSEADHEACLQLVRSLADQAPQLTLTVHAYWAEFFGYWLTLHFQPLTGSASTLVKESDNADLLAQAPSNAAQVKETSPAYTLVPPLSQQVAETMSLITHEPLRPVPEPLLSKRIREVQRYILVDDAVIKRIYHALLAGHVILTGPPGTGKTDLARIIPEILWSTGQNTAEQADGSSEIDIAPLDTKTAYTTRIVTATDEWSVRTLISGIAPQSKNGTVTYNMQYGYLTTTILRNWSFNASRPEEWNSLRRTAVVSQSNIERGTPQTFRGLWLVIDEFNRTPIDLALGDALTALGGNDVLRVTIEGGSAELPIPYDFRLLGTLNSFDRNYLNQISEALKRRFSFVEILPPTRAQRAAEPSIVLYKALKKIQHLSNSIELSDNGILNWESGTIIGRGDNGLYTIEWDDRLLPFHEAFETAWRIFEVIRIYRQLGTAQAISLFQHMLIAGILQGYDTREVWIEQALDAALCDTLADQLQVLLPDEIEALFLYLTTDHATFSEAYKHLLSGLTPNRIYGQLLSLSNVSQGNGQAFFTDEEIEKIAAANPPDISNDRLKRLFHLDYPVYKLPQFTRRLRAFKSERGL